MGGYGCKLLTHARKADALRGIACRVPDKARARWGTTVEGNHTNNAKRIKCRIRKQQFERT